MIFEFILFAYLTWVFGHLFLMIVVRPDVPHFNGFSVLMPEWIEDVLTDEEYRAIWFHEKGHQLHRHVWKNFWLVCTFRRQTPQIRLSQELEADNHALNMGCGAAMATALRKLSLSAHDNVRARRLEMMEFSRKVNGEDELRTVGELLATLDARAARAK